MAPARGRGEVVKLVSSRDRRGLTPCEWAWRGKENPGQILAFFKCPGPGQPSPTQSLTGKSTGHALECGLPQEVGTWLRMGLGSWTTE